MSFYFERLKVFGWIVHRKELFQGETYTVEVSEDTLPSESENITFWTRGRVEGTRTDGYQTLPRVAGLFSLDLPLLAAGSFDFVAVEDSEWFCVNSRANRHALPVLTPVRLNQNDVMGLRKGTLLFVCTGTLGTSGVDLVSGDELQVTSDSGIYVTAKSDVFGLIFAEELA